MLRKYLLDIIMLIAIIISVYYALTIAIQIEREAAEECIRLYGNCTFLT